MLQKKSYIYKWRTKNSFYPIYSHPAMANVLHAPQFLAQHQVNMMTSLAHRLEVARATNNFQLVELLERERQQISAGTSHISPLWNGDRLKDFVQSIIKAIAHRSELQVQQFINGSDRWWYAFDPQTGNSVYADSEAELRLWIRDNYRGR